MRHRSPARWLAPLALVVCCAAVYSVVQNGTSSGHRGKATSSTSHPSSSSTATTKKKTPERRTYTVKNGDVLSAIAQRTGVTVAEIQRLNPSVDPAALHPGQKLRLTP